MKIVIESMSANAATMLRRAGYTFQRNEGNEMSFVRALASAGYPRFHIYAAVVNDELVINIHLDQKKETYGETTRHHGEYENDGALKQEVERLTKVLR